jgi:hypothetical protein
MINGFATSHPGLMLGSVIPGFRQQITQTRLVNYLDFSNEKLLGGRKPSVNPLMEVPNMNEQHSKGHSFLEKLKGIMAGQQHTGIHGPHQRNPKHTKELFGRPPGPKMREGYEAVRENRDWRSL